MERGIVRKYGWDGNGPNISIDVSQWAVDEMTPREAAEKIANLLEAAIKEALAR